MKKYVLASLLLVCLLISLPAAVVDQAFTEVSNNNYYLQTPETTLFSFPEEITINQRGEVPVLLLSDSETIIYDVESFNIPLLEFTIDSDGYHKLNTEVLAKGKSEIIISIIGNPIPEWSGGEDLFFIIKQSAIPKI